MVMSCALIASLFPNLSHTPVLAQAANSAVLTVSPGAVDEDGGAQRIAVTATLAQADPLNPLFIDLAVGAGAGTNEGTHFQRVDDSRLRITVPAGLTTGAASFDLTPIDDSELQPADRSVTISGTLLVETSGTFTALVGGSVTGASVAIDDDDDVLSLSLDKTTVDEDGGTAAVKVTAAFPDGVSRSASTVVNVTVGADADTATGGTDYAVPSPFTITIPASQNSASASFNLAVTDNSSANADKRLTVAGVNRDPGLTVNPATLTILDNEDRKSVV